MQTDEEAWIAYPNQHKWFNKLYLAETLKYKCGPCGVAPKETAVYIVRPIYNLTGMGVGAKLTYIEAGDYSKVPPGYFWCEQFMGEHYSATYEFSHGVIGEWKPVSCWQGYHYSDNDLTKFHMWKRSEYVPKVPRELNELSEVRKINVEFKGNKVIEVHLRTSPDPDYDVIIPVWKNNEIDLDKYEQLGYTYIESFDNGDGFLDNPRIGFMVK